ncbi:hypothetical protein CRV15_25315 [Streptomyces clavuligerus]|uniref:Uncharacterized protein n=1 Tax=Streptomyces clavuligerus TaxID=1901 RepID=B5GZ21_STRCL|nr:hypothetical protein D1794_25945 [Streptomyces clavuligerus]EDY51567.1 hypothetical protein SSCG_04447 [Streptomyces clavuligerus]EFG05661.1 Hypothetical protein SCLAV_0585 [Streptomyces clavuligerus]QCS08634.1 hypothetical protein CRV15_25315 [Streptomyces clavuligerus]QPJ92031.1 hypothetical protein GE265_02825 [Streptomyces clavuligerus]
MVDGTPFRRGRSRISDGVPRASVMVPGRRSGGREVWNEDAKALPGLPVDPVGRCGRVGPLMAERGASTCSIEPVSGPLPPWRP